MRAAPFARVFVKFTAAMLGDLQFPTDSGRLSRDFLLSDPWIFPPLGGSRKRAEGALHFKANVGTAITSITQLSLHFVTNSRVDTQGSQ
jgi:hypothetical protein